MHQCPLCFSPENRKFHQDKHRHYLRCRQCQLIFVDAAQLIDAAAEKAVYEQHENNPQDLGYRGFLRRLSQPLTARLAPASEGLDFGSGPGPTLSLMLEEQGHNMAIYDPYFADDKTVLQKQYDFVTCTEVMEHFYQPHKDWSLLLSLVKPGGHLGVMTKLATDAEAFTRWHYKNDITHVSFFSRETFAWLAERDLLELDILGNDVIIFRKPD